MDMLKIFMRFLILAVSLYGYALYLYNKKRIKTEFIPSVLFSGIGCCVFYAGLLNILEAVVVIIVFGGMYFFAKYRKEKNFPFLFQSWGILLSLILCIIFFCLTYQNKVIHYDDFSHWAMVVRDIVMEDAFPNFENVNIMYRSYPTGSASFIYFFVKVTGIKSEWFFLCVQQLLIIGMFCSLFAFCKPRDVFSYILTFFVVAMLLMSVNNITVSLLVDIILVSSGMAGLVICMYYRDEIERIRILILPITVFLVTVKNSGVFFSAVILIYYFYKARQSINLTKHSNFYNFFLFSAPFVTFFLWDKHVDMVYTNGSSSKHSLSMEYYSSVLREKETDDMFNILQSLRNSIFSETNIFWTLFVIVFLLLIVGKLRRKNLKFLIELAGMVVLFYSIYQLGMCCMYLLSMPLPEALVLAGYDRYHRTIISYLCCIVCVMCLEILDTSKKEAWKQMLCKGIGVVLLICLFETIIQPGYHLLDKQTYEGSDRERLDIIVDQYDLNTSDRLNYIIYWQENSTFRYHVGKYVLNPQEYFCSGVSNFTNTIDKIDDYDYMIVVDHSEEIDAYLQERFGTAKEDAYYVTPWA